MHQQPTWDDYTLSCALLGFRGSIYQVWVLVPSTTVSIVISPFNLATVELGDVSPQVNVCRFGMVSFHRSHPK